MSEMRQCPVCTGFFKARRIDHQYCSRRCKNQKQYKAKVKPPINCSVCAKEFIPRNVKTMTCSPECRYLHEKRREVERGRLARMPFSLPEKKCAVCNAFFKPRTAAQKYCCASCNQDVARKRSWENTQKAPIRPRTCLHCKGEFKPKTRKSMAKFCSAKCRGAYQAARKQEKKDELQKERANFENLQRKWDDSSIQIRDCPPDTAYAKEIWAYLKKGKTITRYLHPIWAVGSTVNEEEEELLELEI